MGKIRLVVFFCVVLLIGSGCSAPRLSLFKGGETIDRAPVVQSMSFSDVKCDNFLKSPSKVSIPSIGEKNFEKDEEKDFIEIEEVAIDSGKKCGKIYKVYATDDFGIVSVGYKLEYVDYNGKEIELKESYSDDLRNSKELFWFDGTFENLMPGEYSLNFTVEDREGNVDSLKRFFFVY
jgi:hypothetical protein